jgi:hypothetical protein
MDIKQMYVDLIDMALQPRSAWSEIMLATSLRDVTNDKKEFKRLTQLRADAEKLETDEQVIEAIALFWLSAWKQR